MAKSITLFRAPFDATATLLKTSKEDLVPFKRGSVIAQLNASATVPTLNLSVDGLPKIVDSIAGGGGLIEDIGGILNKASALDFAGLLSDLVDLVPDIAKFVGQQLGVGLSLLALVGQIGSDDVGGAILSAYQAYFFDPKGYTTLEGGKMSPPTLDAGVDPNQLTLADLPNEMRMYASHKTADQYARDLIRITVEAAGNSLFKLNDRYVRLKALTGPDGKTKQAWFRGFANLAESTVTSAVEQAAQGVSTFSTNPLIAASIGTFAGTAARKATQEVFLAEIGIM
jgi:hypothetical protein